MLGRGGEGGACVAPARANSASHLGTFGARLTWLTGARASGMSSGVSKRTVAAGVSVVQPVCENIALGVVWLTLPFGTRTLDKGAVLDVYRHTTAVGAGVDAGSSRSFQPERCGIEYCERSTATRVHSFIVAMVAGHQRRVVMKRV